MSFATLDRLFAPRSIAVIGASRHAGKVGHTVFTNLTKYGFTGKVYPVNPQATSISGVTCYPDIASIPAVPDLAVIIVPASVVLQTVTACGQKGIPFAIVMSAGFKETGSEGLRREQELTNIVKQYDMRLIGPNCLGMLNTHAHVNATFASPADIPTPGGLAFISQSGALGTAILDVSVTNPLFGLSSFVSLGNKADLDEADLLNYFADDPKTKAIALYIEGLQNGRKLLKAASRVARTKPVIVLKSVRTSSGQKAISSHTGSLAGSDVVYDSAFAASGIIRVDTFQELVDVSIALVHVPKMKQNRLAIVTNAGGPAILATDALANHDLKLSHLHNVTTRRLEKFLPENASIHNPVDILGDALSDRYQGALNIIHRDSQVDAILVVLTPQSMTDIATVAKVVADQSKHSTRPIIACFMGDHRVEAGRKILAEAHIPVFADPNQAVKAIAGLAQYSQIIENQNRSWQQSPDLRVPVYAQEMIATTQQHELERLTLLASLEILNKIGIGIAPTEKVSTLTQAEEVARQWGWPVVMKIDAPALNHKSDAGGVKVNITSQDSLTQAFKELDTLIKKNSWQAASIVMQPQAPAGQQLLIGARRDPTFGPVVTVAMGGIYVEILKDAVTQLAPISTEFAIQSLKSLKSSAILKGSRGQAGISLSKTAAVIVKISELIAAEPAIDQLDINPLFAYEDEVIAVDARIILTPPTKPS